MNSFVLNLRDINRSMLPLVGGKAANLGALTRIEDIAVPGGFCITTDAFKEAIGSIPAVCDLLDQLSSLCAEDSDKIRDISAALRNTIEHIAIPQTISTEIINTLSSFGTDEAYAIRSSATAEDLPGASFAGQQDSYLDITGKDEILKHISRCWASLYTERAIIYRIRNSFDHRQVSIAVIVQQMIFAEASGIMFTADPVSSNRKTTSIDAGLGLGDALVSGLVNADNYKVHQGTITDRRIAVKQDKPVLADGQILQLEQIGRRIEAHFGTPQDIEWCLANDTYYIVQGRPITTLFPIPKADDDKEHVYVSVAHQQMMMDAIKPLGLSFYLLITRAPMRTAGGRLFVDITQQLSSPSGRRSLTEGLGKSEPLIKDALETIVKQKEAADTNTTENLASGVNTISASQEQPNYDPAIVSGLIKSSEASIAQLKQNIQDKSGAELFDCITEDIGHLRKSMFAPKNRFAIMAGIEASAWLNEKMMEWLGEINAADTLSLSAPGNITSEMGLALLDVADVIRPYPEVIRYLQTVHDDNFLTGLQHIPGGEEASNAIHTYLNKFGMRCAGEIDITKPRWSENPAALNPLMLANIKSAAPGAAAERLEHGLQEATSKEQELLERLRQLPGGAAKAEETKQVITRLRNFIGYREYPKYDMISRYYIYRHALLHEADRLVAAGLIHEREDIYYLYFEELREAVLTGTFNYKLIARRKEEHRHFEKLTPPRVITSDGEVFNGTYKRTSLPANALPGLAVSSGTVEGRARVILDMSNASLDEGDILVTRFTDPGWTALFVSIKGLVTEVGGLMTHGSVIAREYGLPAVVSVPDATSLITDGQRIRVNGTEGYVEIL